MTDMPPTAREEAGYHTYTTHRIPWYVRALWIGFWLGLIWYVFQFVIPSAKNYF